MENDNCADIRYVLPRSEIVTEVINSANRIIAETVPSDDRLSIHIGDPESITAETIEPITKITVKTTPPDAKVAARIKSVDNIQNYYDGPYRVVPVAYKERILGTAGKTMKQDVVVEEVPYYEVSNDHGNTIYIGNEVNIYGNK